MTKESFNNIANLQGKEVQFVSYIPSADRYSTPRKGIILRAGAGVNEESVIIGWCGQNLAIHYSRVELI